MPKKFLAGSIRHSDMDMLDMSSPWQTILTTEPWQASTVVLAAPYIKVGALRELLGLIGSEARILCVSRWTPQDVLAGATDIQVKQIIEEMEGIFRLHPSLHAKYYRFDERVLVGSANLTKAALGYGNHPNFEILCHPESSFDVHLFERMLVEDSRFVSDAELATWESLYQLPQDKPFSFGIEQSDWRPVTREPEYVWWIYSGMSERIVDAEQRMFAETDLAILNIPEGLDQTTFNLCVRSCLLATPFINTVLLTEGTDENVIRLEVASDWDLTESEAERAIETANLWLKAFSV